MIARALVIMGVLAGVCEVHAQPRTALVLVPEQSDALSTEVTVRLCGELAAEGFSVTRRASPAGLSPQEGVESVHADASAVLSIAPATDAPLAIWLSDRLAGYTSMARLQAEQETLTPSQLTVRAVELLRARLSERALSADETAWQIVPKREVVVEAPEPAPLVRDPVRVAVGAGASALLGKLDPGWMPVLSLWIGLPIMSRLGLDLDLSGGGFSTRERAARFEGSARVGQAFASGVLALRLRSQRWPEPSLRVGAGAHVLQVEGRASAPYNAHDELGFSPLVSAGVGVRSPSWWHLALAFSADAMVLTRPASVLVARREVARSGRAIACVRAELMVTF